MFFKNAEIMLIFHFRIKHLDFLKIAYFETPYPQSISAEVSERILGAILNISLE